MHVVHHVEARGLLHRARISEDELAQLVTARVDNAIARLRKKIEPDVHHPRFIHTVHGDGYTLTPEGQSSVPNS